MLLRFSLWPATEELFRACFVQALNFNTYLNLDSTRPAHRISHSAVRLGGGGGA